MKGGFIVEYKYKLTVDDYVSMALIMDSLSKISIIGKRFAYTLLIVCTIIMVPYFISSAGYVVAISFVVTLLIMGSVYCYCSTPRVLRSVSRRRYMRMFKDSPHLLEEKNIKFKGNEFLHTDGSNRLTTTSVDMIPTFIIRDNFINRIDEISKGRIVY